jgi:ATP-dependent DNA helicase Rep
VDTARCGGKMIQLSAADNEADKTMLEVAAIPFSTLSEREGDQNVVTLFTPHAAKGLSGRRWCWLM